MEEHPGCVACKYMIEITNLFYEKFYPQMTFDHNSSNSVSSESSDCSSNNSNNILPITIGPCPLELWNQFPQIESLRNELVSLCGYKENVEIQSHIIPETNQQGPKKCPLLKTSQIRCKFCQLGFRSQRQLSRHLQIHLHNKRYCCHKCEKGFNDSFDLKRHIRTHTHIRPFKCSLCPNAFTQRCSLEAHEKRIHGKIIDYKFGQRRPKLFICEDCGSTFENNVDFKEHTSIHEPNTNSES
ncbi:Transcription factor Ovo-like 2 [Thelohanellus kitauei]|uniref:Transcription factor Ovo-like 2 n=1 Tax=Thelohanellus kitauei TaxID=669202 RepID=A0A0C2MMD5_THEKT|nr:Transcription factor Ovo-like 2 [Thelohanellus kitauei]